MLIYLDACALNRLFDDRTQARVRAEAEAMEAFFGLLQSTPVVWAAGETLEEEISPRVLAMNPVNWIKEVRQ